MNALYETLLTILKLLTVIVPLMTLYFTDKWQSSPPKDKRGKFRLRPKWVSFTAYLLGALGVLITIIEYQESLSNSVEESKSRAALLSTMGNVEATQTGGDLFCYWMLYDFDLDRNVARDFTIIHHGAFPLYDVGIRIYDLGSRRDIYEAQLGEQSVPASYELVAWPLNKVDYYRVFFSARNGGWTQDLILVRSKRSGCWLAATRIKRLNGSVSFEHVDNGFVEQFGQPQWQP